MPHLMHLIECRFPGNTRALRFAVISASAALLGVGVLLVLQ
jgi:hypothetical protein